MFPYSSGLTFTKVLFGVSRTIKIIESLMPLYNNVKPLINSIPKIINQSKKPIKISNPSSNELNINSNINGPTFFIKK